MAFKSLEMEQVGTGQLRALEIGIASRCNFRCDYCGAYDLLERKILSVDDVARIIDTLPDLGRVKLSGGEVLLEFEIWEGTSRTARPRASRRRSIRTALRSTRRSSSGSRTPGWASCTSRLTKPTRPATRRSTV